MQINKHKINIMIRNLIINETKVSIQPNDLTDDLDLLSSKIIDSITFVKLVNNLEKTFNIEFGILDLSIENFKNIKLVTKKIEKMLIK